MSLDVNKLLTPALIRIRNDSTLQTLLDTTVIQAIKGAKRPTAIIGTKCFTVHVLSNNRDEDTKVYNGTLVINFYCPNYSDGNANVELMGPVAAQIVELFDDEPLTMDGYGNYNLAVQEPLGPLYDPDFPNEHYMNVRIQFNLYKKTS
jgi:hypothetical protein